ncbi:MAG: hypothetical protein KAR17_01920, partial [Cyclobacteriaceae bacterium]|nr:hypothetical protein [Cyclobacteriaceae bacterium]
TFSLKRTLKGIWWLLLLATIYAVIIYLLSSIIFHSLPNIPPGITAVLGTAVSLLLGFRTNAAYERWWEARKIWGAIINDSRTFVRQLKGFIDINYSEYDQVISRLAQLQIAFVYTLKNALRQTDYHQEYEMYLSKEELRLIKNQSNKPNAILDFHQKIISKLHDEDVINSIQFANLDNTLKNLCNSMGKSERIKNTVFPIHYSSSTRLAIIIYSLLFPFGVILQDAIYMIPLTFIVVFFFTFIERIATYLQDPFDNKKSDTPLSAIARTIEINLLEMIGEESVPKKLVSEKGVLM